MFNSLGTVDKNQHHYYAINAVLLQSVKYSPNCVKMRRQAKQIKITEFVHERKLQRLPQEVKIIVPMTLRQLERTLQQRG